MDMERDHVIYICEIGPIFSSIYKVIKLNVPRPSFHHFVCQWNRSRRILHDLWCYWFQRAVYFSCIKSYPCSDMWKLLKFKIENLYNLAAVRSVVYLSMARSRIAEIHTTVLVDAAWWYRLKHCGIYELASGVLDCLCGPVV